MKKEVSFWKLFWFIIKITFIGFGGGNALMPVIKKEVVDKNSWITPNEFDEIVIVTNMLPGASVIQTISYISIKLLGKLKGTLVTLVAIFPHVMMAFGLLLLFNKIPTQYIKIISVGVLVSIIAFLIDFGYRFIKQSKDTFKTPIWILIFLFSFSYSLFIPSPYNIPIVAILVVISIYTIIYFILKNKKGGDK
ncbi:chromate ion transporter [Mycoplasmopsis canis PG 14]|uniref:Chromate transporter n=1 Tax=Mycoplasmopsis canis TaxID=29555 RepID=A0A449ARE4_9BACT|nr:chromate transporter [Mycoplasmopsis canis]AMD81483.1 chromate transporter [Mycoplasmopsis canis PG 14]EIE39498.1 chromate ion transporter [Mycoplasmopsis canis PG 14]VEU69113.1 chromate transporter [Mycoplasmopsis canis]